MKYMLIWPEISNMTKPYTTISFEESASFLRNGSHRANDWIWELFGDSTYIHTDYTCVYIYICIYIYIDTHVMYRYYIRNRTTGNAHTHRHKLIHFFKFQLGDSPKDGRLLRPCHVMARLWWTTWAAAPQVVAALPLRQYLDEVIHGGSYHAYRMGKKVCCMSVVCTL